MRVGILVVGSLLWRQTPERVQWRRERLLVEKKVSVRAPIYYGRLSKSGTYTMTLARGGAMGLAVVVPCRAKATNVKGLVEEAQCLWKAESPTATLGLIGASWGSVGVVFRKEPESELALTWAKWFGQSKTRPIAPFDGAGKLRIPWPKGALDFDVLMATATEPSKPRVTAQAVADVWVANGGEEYFFRNVEHGIRTPDDPSIWARLKERGAQCLQSSAYKKAFALLAEPDPLHSFVNGKVT